MASTAFDERFERACAEGLIPHAVLVAWDRSGKFHYEKTFGTRAVNDTTPIDPEAIMWIASCTKLMTSMAALQCVSRGLITLDAPLGPLLPELEGLDIVIGIDAASGAPILKKSTKPITLRLLLTHSAGFTYEVLSPGLQAWRKSRGEAFAARKGSVKERFLTPLVFEPGEGFAYGPCIDWVGKVVEKLSGLDLEAYLKKEVWGPLGVRDMTFDLSSRPDLQERFIGTAERVDGVLKEKDLADMPYVGAEEAMGGQGVFACAREYGLILRAVLCGDERLGISTTLWDEAFKPQLSAPSRAALGAVLADEAMNRVFAGTPGRADRKDWGLGGLLTLDKELGGREANTLSWGGLPNLVWWVDREEGLAGLYAGQVVPTGDRVCSEMNRAFEEEMYRRFGAWKEGEGREKL